MNKNWKKLILAGYFIVCLFASGLVTGAVASEKASVFTDKNEAAGYNPGASYTGEFIQSKLYYHNPHSVFWRSMSRSDNYRDVVTCQSALVSLATTGKWQGHLNQDGSCGPLDEPSLFALGNRINLDISLDQDVSSN